MDRLTERKYGELVSVKNEETGMSCSSFCNKCSQGSGNCKYVKEMVEKLAVYEDLEEQGFLLRLPCKVGDTVYMVSQVFNGVETTWGVSSRNIDKVGGNKLNPVYMISSEPYELRFCTSEFGKRAFLTREEAEAALEKMKENGEE